MEEQELSNEEMAQLAESAGLVPTPEDKHNIHTFLHKVATADDTTKTGNLTDDEIGTAKLPLRTQKDLALFSHHVLKRPVFANYFASKGEILTSTSLSKEAKLLSLAITTSSRQSIAMAQQLGNKKENKGWFKKKNPQPVSQY